MNNFKDIPLSLIQVKRLSSPTAISSFQFDRNVLDYSIHNTVVNQDKPDFFRGFQTKQAKGSFNSDFESG